MTSSLREMNIFGDMKIYGYFFLEGGGGHHEIGLYLGVISMHFRLFSLRQDFLRVAKISNIFEVLIIPDISWG